MSSLLDQILDVLRKAQAGKHMAGGLRILDWRITCSQTQMITLGIKNNSTGGVYSPPALKDSERAEIYLIWEDGKCSRSVVQNPPPGRKNRWQTELNGWRAAAFKDKYAARIPEPSELPDVGIAEQKLHDIVCRDRSCLFEQQGRIRADEPVEALKNGQIMAIWGKSNILTSTGIQAAFEESRYAVSWSFDSIVAEGFAERRLITAEEWLGLWEESVCRYRLLENQGEPVRSATKVILTPAVVSQMIDQYILPNFRGENVLERQSRFTTQDFSGHIPLFDPELTIEINPLLPGKWASYVLTNEGVPAMRTELLRDGRLETPYLNLKDAGRFGAGPTAIPYSSAGIRVKHTRKISWKDLVGTIEDGIMILSVLGLHTQNPVTGTFSLTAPCALRIKNGVVAGKTDVRINGNFWDILRREDTVYADHPLYNHPYLMFHIPPDNL